MDYEEQAVEIASADAQAMNEEGLSDKTASVVIEKRGKGKSALDILKENGIEL